MSSELVRAGIIVLADALKKVLKTKEEGPKKKKETMDQIMDWPARQFWCVKPNFKRIERIRSSYLQKYVANGCFAI